MAVLNLRDVPDNLAAQLKSEAALAGLGYHEYCVVILSNRGSIGRTLALVEESRKKIADISVGGGATEGGGDPCLPRGGKAQDWPVFDNPRGVPGNSVVVRSDGNPTITVTREEFDGAQGRGKAGQDCGVAGGDSQANTEGDDVAEGGAVAIGKPGVNMQALRDICAGKGIRAVPLSVEPTEVDLCGFKAHNEEDGEWYVCAKEKHGPKVKHGEWLKI